MVDVFNRVCRGVRWVHPGSLGSLRCALGVVEFIWGGTRARPGGRWVHPVSLCSPGSALLDVGFMWDH